MSGRLLLGVLYRWVIIFGCVCLRLRLRLRVAINVFFDKGARIFAGHRGIGRGHELVGSVRWPQSKSPQKAVFHLSSLSAAHAMSQTIGSLSRARRSGSATRKRTASITILARPRHSARSVSVGHQSRSGRLWPTTPT